MPDRHDHPSYLFPMHGETRAIHHIHADGTVESTPPDFEQRAEADRSAVWRRVDRPLDGARILTRGPRDTDWRPLMETIVEFEPVADCAAEDASQAHYYCPVCGIDFDYRAAPDASPAAE